MAVSASVTVGGVVRATWDDATEQYQEFAADGTTVTLTRAYTAVELAQKAERATRSTAQSNDAALRAQLSAGIAALTSDITDLNALASQAAPATLAIMWTRHQALGAGLRRTNKAVVGLARIISNSLSSADTGV